MKSRKVTFIFAGLIGVGFIASVAKIRYDGAINPKYHAALYYAHVRAIDDQTSDPISVEVEWDFEQISPYSKGSGPSVIQSNEDKSVTIALVGKKLDEGLKGTLDSRGYYREVLELDPEKTWTLSAESSKIQTVVRFKRINSQN